MIPADVLDPVSLRFLVCVLSLSAFLSVINQPARNPHSGTAVYVRGCFVVFATFSSSRKQSRADELRKGVLFVLFQGK